MNLVNTKQQSLLECAIRHESVLVVGEVRTGKLPLIKESIPLYKSAIAAKGDFEVDTIILATSLPYHWESIKDDVVLLSNQDEFLGPLRLLLALKEIRGKALVVIAEDFRMGGEPQCFAWGHALRDALTFDHHRLPARDRKFSVWCVSQAIYKSPYSLHSYLKFDHTINTSRNHY